MRQVTPLATAPYIPYIQTHEQPSPHQDLQVWQQRRRAPANGLAIPADVEVAPERSGDIVTIRTLRDPVVAKKALLDMLDELQKQPKPPTVQKRDPF